MWTIVSVDLETRTTNIAVVALEVKGQMSDGKHLSFNFQDTTDIGQFYTVFLRTVFSISAVRGKSILFKLSLSFA